MTSYPINSFSELTEKEVMQECLKEIDECRETQGNPSHYCITVERVGGHESILVDSISELGEAVNQIIITLNSREWNDDDLYVSIEGIYKEMDLITPLYVELLNDDPDIDF